MSFCISLTLEASEMFLSLHMIFSLEKLMLSGLSWKESRGFDPLLEMIVQRHLKFSTTSSLWPFILISLWKPFVCFFFITTVLSGLIFILYVVGGCTEMVDQDASFFFLFCIYDNVICKAKVGSKSSSNTHDQDQDRLLVKCWNDNHSPGPVIREISP